MNSVSHLLAPVLIQITVAVILRSWLAGAFAGSAWAIAREITQAEYRWIEVYGEGLRANMPWWGGLDLRVWGLADPWLDWVVPVAVTFAFAILMDLRKRRRRQ